MESIMTNADKCKLTDIFNSTETNSQYFTEISDKLVKSYTSELDSLMSDLYEDAIESDASDAVLEKYLIELGNLLYFLGTKLESVGIKEDLSKMAAKEVYNNAYLNNRLKDSEKKNKMPVAELSALAEDASRYESVMNSIYSRTYKQIKFKVDAGYDMINTIRKIITKRMNDQNLSRMNLTHGN